MKVIDVSIILQRMFVRNLLLKFALFDLLRLSVVKPLGSGFQQCLTLPINDLSPDISQ